mgnify:CR=1 FL=1
MTNFNSQKAIVFIDAAVADYQSLVAGVNPDTEVIIIDAAKDGIYLMTDVLASRSDISAVHIVAHGSPGCLYLGNSQLSLDTLSRYAAQLQNWKTVECDRTLLLYGCNVAVGDAGAEFIAKLHQLTGANIAAATNKIGNAELGGNWNLAYTTGEIETPLAFHPEVMQAYSFVLVEFVNESFTTSDVASSFWIFKESGGSNVVGLTASGGDGTPLPNLNIDTSGNGALRLTSTEKSQAGFVLFNNPISSTEGVEVTFDFFAYNGTGADGISFFLVDGSGDPTTPGTPGKGLGYLGLEGGYVGIGFDEFGNFGNTSKDSVAIRGSLANGNNLLQSVSVANQGGIDAGSVLDRNSALRRAQIVLTPSNAPQPNRLSVAMDFNLDGDFLDAGETVIAPFDITKDNGAVPTTFKFGFAASTGASTNIHEIRNLSYETVNLTADIIGVSAQPLNSSVSSITIRFSEAVTGFDINDLSLTRNSSTVSLAGATLTTTDNIIWTLGNISGLTGTDGNYQLTLNAVGSDIVSSKGGAAISSSAKDSWTIDVTPPTLTSVTPSDNATNVAINSNLVLTLSETVTAGTGNITIRKVTDNSPVETIAVNSSNVTISGNTVTINPTNDLQVGTEYYIAIDATAFRDAAGNTYAGIANNTAWTFTTFTTNTPPALTGTKATFAPGSEDTVYTIKQTDLLAGFTDADGDTLSVTNFTANNGTLANNNNGTWSFTPNTNYNGTVNLSYDVIDGKGGSTKATQSFTLAAVNDAPSLTGTKATFTAGSQNTTYTIKQIDLLAGFTDVDGDTLSVINLTANNGTLANNNNGTWSFTAGANFTGTVNLSYEVTDGKGGNIPATQSFNIQAGGGGNNPPVLSGTKATFTAGTEDIVYTIKQTDLLAGFTDADGDTLSVTNFTANNGTLANNNNGTWSFTPNTNYNGTVNLSYDVIDGKGGSTKATQSFTLAAVNDAPSLTGTKATFTAGSQNTTYTIKQIDLLAGFTDAEGDTLSVINLTASNGTLVDNKNGTWSFTPNANFTGTVNLSYEVTDGKSSNIPATQSFAIDINNPDDTPRAISISDVAQVEGVNGSTNLGFTVSLNNASSQTVTVNYTTKDSTATTADNDYTSASGTVTFNPGERQKTVSISINGDTKSEPDETFEVKLSSAVNAIIADDTGVGTIRNDDSLPGVVGNINKTGDEDTTIGFTAAEFSSKFSETNNVSLAKIKVTSLPNNGTLQLANSNVALNQEISLSDLANIRFIPLANWNGNTSFTWKGFDGVNYAIADAVVNLIVNPVNDAPFVNIPINNQSATVNGGLNFTFPADTFKDVDFGSILTYSVTLANGNSLPSWLNFNPTTRSFVGIPTTSDIGNLTLLLKATDSSNASVVTPFNLTVQSSTGGGSDSDCFCVNLVHPNIDFLPGLDQGPNLVSAINSGSDNRDILIGTNASDQLTGFSGNDWITGLKGDDNIIGGTENETIYGGQGRDWILGEFGDDWISGDKGDDWINSGVGNDTVYGRDGNDFARGGKNEDLMFGDSGDDTLGGDKGNDTLFGGADDYGRDLLFGGEGNDLLSGNQGNDTLVGNEGNDTLRAGQNDDIAFGDAGDDVLYGDKGNDSLCGGDGNDTMYGGNHSDIPVVDNTEEDWLCGSKGNDLLFGDEGRDNLNGSDGEDTLYGGIDNDTLTGGTGNDRLYGDQGQDLLRGGQGSDFFGLRTNSGTDTILDFTDGEDLLALRGGLTFSQLNLIDSNGTALIGVQNSSEILAILPGVQASLLGQQDFISFI